MSKLWKWTKRLLWVVAGLFGLLLISVSVLVYLINSESFLESQIQKRLGVRSEVGELEVSLLSGTVTLSQTRIGPSEKPIISFEKLTAEVSYSGLFSELLVDSIQLDQAVIRYPFDFQMAPSSEAEQQLSDETFFFDKLNIANILINNSDFILNDERPLEAKDIDLVINDLPIAENGLFLFSHIADFFATSQTSIEASIGTFTTDKSALSGLTLVAKVVDDNVVIEQLESNSASINIDLLDYSTNASSSSGTVQAKQSEPLILPFNDLLVQTIKVGSTDITINTENEQTIRVKDLVVSFSDLTLVKDKVPLWGDWQQFYALQNSHYQASTKQFFANSFSFDALAFNGQLRDAEFIIDTLKISQPIIKYQSDGNAANNDSTVSMESPQPVAKNSPEDIAIEFPFSSLLVKNGTINKGDISLSFGIDTYSAKSVDLEWQQLPVISEHKLVVAEPKRWQRVFMSTVTVEDLQLPQGSVGKLASSLESEKGQLTLSQIRVDEANLSLEQVNGNAENNNVSQPEVEFPLEAISLQDVAIKSLDLKVKLADNNFQVDKADIDISYFPLVIEGRFFEAKDLSTLQSSFSLSVDALQNSEFSIVSIRATGELADDHLKVSSLSNQSGTITFDLLATEALPDTAQQHEVQSLPIKTITIDSASIKNLQARINQSVTVENEEGKPNTSKQVILVNGIDFTANNLQLAKNHQLITEWYDKDLKRAFKQVDLKIAKVQRAEDTYSDIVIKAVQSGNAITFQPLTVKVNDAQLNADWNIDLGRPDYFSTFKFDVQSLALESLHRPATDELIGLNGKVNGLADLTFTGLTQETIFKSLNGQILITNDQSIQLVNLNINKVLERFLESQEFGLLDIGGFVLAGPAGLLLSQGVSMQGILSNLGANKGDTLFGQLNIDMVVENGILKTRDVAAATRYYRFAFDGNVDLSIMAFNDFEFMILNDEGCKEYSQTLNGSLTDPEIETFRTAFDAVTGSVVGLLKSGVGLLTGGYCEGVYDGKVVHPEKGAEISHPELKPEEPETTEPIEQEEEVSEDIPSESQEPTQ